MSDGLWAHKQMAHDRKLIEKLRAELAAANERTEQVRLSYDARLSLADADINAMREALREAREVIDGKPSSDGFYARIDALLEKNK